MKYTFSILAICLSLITTAQVNNTNLNKAVYSQALKAGDVSTAIQAANYIIAADNNSSFKDSLAVLYYSSNNLAAAYYWANVVLDKNANNVNMLEVKARCLKNSDQLLPAVDAFTALYKMRPTAVNGFELMSLQYDARRILECAAVANEVLTRVKIDSNLVAYYSVDNKTRKQTPLKAAMLNIYGLSLLELKKTNEAQQVFEQALAIDKDYTVAQNNLLVAKQANVPAEKTKEEKHLSNDIKQQ